MTEPLKIGDRTIVTKRGIVNEHGAYINVYGYISPMTNALVWFDADENIYVELDTTLPAFTRFSPDGLTITGEFEAYASLADAFKKLIDGTTALERALRHVGK